MRSIGWVGAGLVYFMVLVTVRSQPLSGNIGPDWRTRPILEVVTNDQNTVSYQTNIVVELGGGMNRWNDDSARKLGHSVSRTIKNAYSGN